MQNFYKKLVLLVMYLQYIVSIPVLTDKVNINKSSKRSKIEKIKVFTQGNMRRSNFHRICGIDSLEDDYYGCTEPEDYTLSIERPSNVYGETVLTSVYTSPNSDSNIAYNPSMSAGYMNNKDYPFTFTNPNSITDGSKAPIKSVFNNIVVQTEPTTASYETTENYPITTSFPPTESFLNIAITDSFSGVNFSPAPDKPIRFHIVANKNMSVHLSTLTKYYLPVAATTMPSVMSYDHIYVPSETMDPVNINPSNILTTLSTPIIWVYNTSPARQLWDYDDNRQRALSLKTRNHRYAYNV